MSLFPEQAARLAALGNAGALTLLLAEMTALSAMMPGLSRSSGDPARASMGHGLPTDAEVEAGFDNMPV